MLFIGYLFFTALPVKAAQEFTSNYDVTYRFNETGVSTVEQRISLTNLTSQVYATQYQLSYEGEPPQNISGSDSSGPLKISSTPTAITVNFNDQIVGRGQTLHFTLTYNSLPAVLKGQIWEISLPRLGNPEAIDNYQLKLIVPTSFGRPAYISPSPSSVTANQYFFTKDQLVKTGVIAAFGNIQSYGFTLTYELQNPKSLNQTATIALPPDSPYQRVYYDSLSPLPQNITTDSDGNWIATYALNPNQQLTITAVGQAHLVAKPSYPSIVPPQVEMPAMTQATTYWPTTDPTIQKLSKSLTTPEAIYNYVVNALQYDYNLIKTGSPRKGGAAALNTPDSSLCTEFTDAFITLARAAGIPAREINGYGYTTDSRLRPLGAASNVLHAWPQYWDAASKNWINIDPTWGKTTGGIDYFTKFDFSHFAFVTHGQSDSTPYPPSHATVELESYRDYPPTLPKVTWVAPWQVFPFVSTPSQLQVQNTSGQAQYRLSLSISPSHFTLSSPGSSFIPLLPPFSQITVPLNFAPHSLPNFAAKSFVVSLQGNQISYNVPNKLFIGWQTILGTLIALLIITLGFVAHQAWSLHFQGRRRENPLRR